MPRLGLEKINVRTIKFRVWDKSKSYMIFPVGDYWFNDEENTITFAMDNVVGDHDDGTRFELLLFTGLSDKKGKEIYEGDIIRWFDNYNKPETHQVKWSDKWSCFDFPMWAVDGGKGFYDFEVIGNVYESPELLK